MSEPHVKAVLSAWGMEGLEKKSAFSHKWFHQSAIASLTKRQPLYSTHSLCRLFAVQVSGRKLVETESAPAMENLKEVGEESMVLAAEGTEYAPAPVLTGSVSWLQLLQRNLPAAATSFMSPNAVRRGSLATTDTFDGNSTGVGEEASAASSTPFEAEMASMWCFVLGLVFRSYLPFLPCASPL